MHGEIVIRDQRPLSVGKLERCLTDMSVTEWLRLLNRKVFFWLIEERVEQLLGAKVASIRTSIAHGKVKRQGKFAGRRSDWKKAFVKLRAGEKMPEFLEGA